MVRDDSFFIKIAILVLRYVPASSHFSLCAFQSFPPGALCPLLAEQRGGRYGAVPALAAVQGGERAPLVAGSSLHFGSRGTLMRPDRTVVVYCLCMNAGSDAARADCFCKVKIDQRFAEQCVTVLPVVLPVRYPEGGGQHLWSGLL